MEIGGGLVIASYPLKMLTLACAAAVLPACLITERKDYQEPPSVPPFIVTGATARFPLDRIIVLDDVPGPDGGVAELRLDGITVYEPNVNRRLEARVFVNRPWALPDMESAFPYATTPGETLRADLTSTNPADRPFSFTVDTTSRPFDPLRCNKIELVVASEFTALSKPVEPNDSARVVWWAGPRGADMAACP